MGGGSCQHGRNEKCKTLDGQCERKRSFAISRRRSETDLKERIPTCEGDTSGSEQGPTKCSPERDNVPASSITYVNLLTGSAIITNEECLWVIQVTVRYKVRNIFYCPNIRILGSKPIQDVCAGHSTFVFSRVEALRRVCLRPMSSSKYLKLHTFRN